MVTRCSAVLVMAGVLGALSPVWGDIITVSVGNTAPTNPFAGDCRSSAAT
jgi:hypothetical protein